MLDKTKRHVLLSKLNFLGYERKPRPSRISLSNVRYIGDYENTFITMDNYGLLPSIAQLMHRAEAKSEEAEGAQTQVQESQSNEQTKD